MNQENADIKEGISLREIFYVLRANILLIILVVVLAGAIGAVYSKVRKPYYTATERVSYSADVGEDVDNRIIRNINAMTAYINTVVDFCRTGVVLDTANSYYNYYILQKKEAGSVGIDEFINRIKANPDNYPCLSEEELKEINHFNKGIISSKASSSSNTASSPDMFSFTLSVTGLDAEAVKAKVRILAVASNHEITNYFGGVTSTIIELTDSVNGVSVSTDMSARRIIVISLLIGVILALAIVYIKHIADNTVKDKETLEYITGSNVIAYIDDVNGGSYGRAF